MDWDSLTKRLTREQERAVRVWLELLMDTERHQQAYGDEIRKMLANYWAEI